MSDRRRVAGATGILFAISVAAFVSLFTTGREAQAQSIMPQRAKVVEGVTLTVIVKNPDGIDGGVGHFFDFDAECQISEKSEYEALAQYGSRVLVVLDHNDHKLKLGTDKACPTNTVFWRSEQQFRMAAQEYRRHMAHTKAQHEERDLIRRLAPRKSAEIR